MAFNSITRLRVRSVLTLPAFFGNAAKASAQAAKAPGFLSGALLPEGRMVFWTRTAWESEAVMKAYRDSDAHRAVMPKLIDWCDEASVAHWEGEEASDWDEIYRRMVDVGRTSRVRRPTLAHQEKRFDPMRRWMPENPIPRKA